MATTNTLWTPDRNVPLHTKGVDTISAKDMQTLADLDALARKLRLVLVCLACDSHFQGQNDGKARTSSIWCRCREIRADTGSRLV